MGKENGDEMKNIWLMALFLWVTLIFLFIMVLNVEKRLVETEGFIKKMDNWTEGLNK